MSGESGRVGLFQEIVMGRSVSGDSSRVGLCQYRVVA